MAIGEFLIKGATGLKDPTKKQLPAVQSLGASTVRSAIKFDFREGVSLDLDLDIPVNVSDLGTLVLDNLEIQPGQYADLRTGDPIAYPGIRIDTVLFDAQQTKNIVKTKIQGREGTVKEYISSEDVTINVQGLLVNKSNNYPATEAEQLKQIFDVPQQLRVTSKFINDVLGLDFIVIETWRMNQLEGFRNVQPFFFTASSDVDLNINDIEQTSITGAI
jgi:hypothetical protein